MQLLVKKRPVKENDELCEDIIKYIELHDCGNYTLCNEIFFDNDYKN